MQLRTRVQECLDNGSTAYGALCFLNSPLAVDILTGDCGFDFVGIDMQHGDIGVESSRHLLRAIQSADPMTTPFVRVPTQDKYWIEQSLDAGYAGIIVPQVESADEARRLVQAFRYPPEGARSRANTIRASLYENYFENANSQLLLLPQIESPAGLQHCEEIINEPGVSGALLGPGDLALSCGWPLKDSWSHAPFAEAAERVARACKEAGKVSAIVTGGLDNAIRSREAGFQLISFVGDGAGLRNQVAAGARRELDELRNA